MQLFDFKPPPSPSLDQQRDALKKGLGRAMQWAKSGALEDEPLLEACLRDQRYDVQLEDSRGEWIWGLILAAGAVDRFRVPILHTLYDLSDERNAEQVCELGGRYAESGDESFRMLLYEIVEKKPCASRLWLGEEENLRLDGERAFLFAARPEGNAWWVANGIRTMDLSSIERSRSSATHGWPNSWTRLKTGRSGRFVRNGRFGNRGRKIQSDASPIKTG